MLSHFLNTQSVEVFYMMEVWICIGIEDRVVRKQKNMIVGEFINKTYTVG